MMTIVQSDILDFQRGNIDKIEEKDSEKEWLRFFQNKWKVPIWADGKVEIQCGGGSSKVRMTLDSGAEKTKGQWVFGLQPCSFTVLSCPQGRGVTQGGAPSFA